MGFEDYISEIEAASIAGVSANTLNRFAEAGYLQVEADSDGLRLFSRRELGEVFGFRQEVVFDGGAVRVVEPAVRVAEEPEAKGEAEDTKKGKESFKQKEVEVEDLVDNVPVDNVVELHVESSSQSNSSQVDGRVELATQETVEPLDADDIWAEESSASIAEKVGDVVEKVVSIQSAGVSSDQSQTVRRLEMEVQKLTNVIAMQDKLLDLRDAELKDLKEQRQWLHERVERLEEKSDRDQMLLLAETQLVRQMITQREQKRSPMRAALEWFGLVNEEQAQGPVVEGRVSRDS